MASGDVVQVGGRYLESINSNSLAWACYVFRLANIF